MKTLKQNFIIFDGNPKFIFGGGQKVSIDILKSLQGQCICHLVEMGETPVFFTRCQIYISSFLRLRFPWRNSSTLEAATYPLYWIWGFALILIYFRKKNFKPENCVLYSASKKSHLYLFFLKHLGYKVIAHVQTLDSPNKISTRIFQKIFPSFDQIWGTTPLHKDIYPNCNLHIFPIAVHQIAPKGKTLPSEGRIIVSTLSSLIPIKGLEDFIESRHFLKHPEKFEYWIAGEGPSRMSLEKLAQGQIRFLGFIENPARILQDEVHVLVFPTVIPEAFGLGLLEAFAMGVPGITTALGHQRLLSLEFMNTEGIPTNNPRGIAEELEKLTSDTEVYASISRRLIEKSHQYSFEAFQEKIRRLVQE